MVRNGDKVKDRVTGFTGIVIGITTWLNGCIRAGIQSEAFRDGLPIDPYWVDVGQLEVLEQKVLEQGGRVQPLDPPGGPVSRKKMPKRAPDPKR